MIVGLQLGARRIDGEEIQRLIATTVQARGAKARPRDVVGQGHIGPDLVRYELEREVIAARVDGRARDPRVDDDVVGAGR